MNAADLARLEVAKRAFRAVEPSTAEVQRGVRKARLSLRRPRQRRAWFSKTLVAVVLAMGGLAYAKPQALGEWVEGALRSRASTSPKRAGGAATTVEATPTPRLVEGGAAVVAVPRARATQAPLVDAPGLAPELPRSPVAQPQPASGDPQPVEHTAASPKAPTNNPASARAPTLTKPDQPGRLDQEQAKPALGATSDQQEGAEAGVASEWGRVGEALARGDETRALAALKELSQSDDARTRDKADLGRAQLLMGSGHRDQACTMARSLSNRRAGSRIERQAQVLLKSCVRDNH
jgi:hypothetical protein